MVRIKSILAALAVVSALVGYLPLLPYLDSVARWLLPLAVAFGVYADRRGMPHRGRLLTATSLLFFVYYGMGLSLDRLVPVTSNLLVCLLAVRMLGEKNGRNYLQISALSLFCLAASSLYNLSGIFVWYLLLLLLILAVSIVLLTFHAHDPEMALDRPALKRVLGSALLLPAASLPVMLILFVILPRTQYPLWDFLKGGGGKTVGLSEEVRPGTTPSVTSKSTPAFRVVCPKVPEGKLYWRGIVLNGFSGDSWVRRPVPEEHSLPMAKHRMVTQEIYPEPSRAPYLLALNMPLGITGIRNVAGSDMVFTTSEGGARRVSYQAISDLSGALKVEEIDRPFYLQLPAHVPGRLAAKAREIGASARTTPEKLALLERFFRSQKLSYATAGMPVGTEALDQFLFSRKKGNCEYFASSAALMLRIAGVPARLAGGYKGGAYNEAGRYYLVTEDMAHVWVEVYVDGEGWRSIEPSGWSADFARVHRGPSRLRMYLDAAGFYWNKAVVTYDLQKQINLFQAAGTRLKNVSAPKLSPKPLVLIAALAALLIAVYRVFTVPRASAGQKLLKAFLAAVARRYPALDVKNCGIFELARRTGDPLLHDFVSVYGAAFYGDRPLGQDEVARLKRIVAELQKKG